MKLLAQIYTYLYFTFKFCYIHMSNLKQSFSSAEVTFHVTFCNSEIRYPNSVSSVNDVYTDHGSKITMHQGCTCWTRQARWSLFFKTAVSTDLILKLVWYLGKKKIQRWLFKVCTFDALYFIHLSKASLIRMDKYLIMLLQEKHWP